MPRWVRSICWTTRWDCPETIAERLVCPVAHVMTPALRTCCGCLVASRAFWDRLTCRVMWALEGIRCEVALRRAGSAS